VVLDHLSIHVSQFRAKRLERKLSIKVRSHGGAKPLVGAPGERLQRLRQCDRITTGPESTHRTPARQDTE